MPIITFNVSNATAQRVQDAFDSNWPEDAPHDAAAARQKIWFLVKNLVQQQERIAAQQALASPADLPDNDG